MSNHTTTPPGDRGGLAIDATPEAAAHYREGVDRLLCMAGGAAGALESALEADPRFDLARITLALARLVEGRADLAFAALRDLGRDPEDAIAWPLAPRDLGLFEIVRACVAGDDEAARRIARRHLRAFPQDLLAFTCLLLSAQRGDDLAARQEVAIVAAEIAPWHEGDWAFSMLRAYALDDLGQDEEALAFALRALALRPDCATAARVVARIRCDQGELREGLRALSDWLARHTPSATALVQLRYQEARLSRARGEPYAALRIYERWIRPAAEAEVPGALQAAAGLLWSLTLDGVVTQPAWDALHPRAAAVAGAGTGSATGDIHVAFALAGAGDLRALARLASAVRRRAERGDAAAGGAVLPIVLGLWALCAGEVQEAAAHLERAVYGLPLCSGGPALRPMIQDTVVEAYLGAGRLDIVQRRVDAWLPRVTGIPRDEPGPESDPGPRTPVSSSKRGPGSVSSSAPASG